MKNITYTTKTTNMVHHNVATRSSYATDGN